MDHRQRSFTKLRKTNIAKKMNFLIKDFFSKWPNPQFSADLVTFTEEILNGKPHFLCSANSRSIYEIFRFRLWALKSGFDSNQGFPYESSSHILYKALYVNSFYSLYYHHHYDYCIVNIVILYYMQTWKLYIIKRIYCLFVCLCDSS